MAESLKITDIWDRIKKMMLIMNPLHTRRIAFLNMTMKKSIKISESLHYLKAEAREAEIGAMKGDCLFLHILVNNLHSTDELAKTVKIAYWSL